MELFSTTLVSDDLLTSIQKDLEDAAICRFLVAYISASGLQSIGMQNLARVLTNPDSFGVGSLSCACGYQPLLLLEEEVSKKGATEKLKYFMDPLVEDGESEGLSLFHSKLVYIVSKNRERSIAYIGSHNWTQRALGPGSPRNAESTVRIEDTFHNDHLKGVGTSIFSGINQHLIEAFTSPVCIHADGTNRTIFEQWFAKGCGRGPRVSLRETVVVLAVHSGAQILTPDDWNDSVRKGIYFQVHRESEGAAVWNAGDRILIFVWDSQTDLENQEQPLLLKCRITTENAGKDSNLQGSNASRSPISGFEAVLWDENHQTGLLKGLDDGVTRTTLTENQDVEFYDLEFPSTKTDSSVVDGGVDPKYQFYLEIEKVIFPREGKQPNAPHYVWDRNSLAIAEKKDDAKLEKPPGFLVHENRRNEMKRCLSGVFGVDLAKAKVLPYSGQQSDRLGKKMVDHPLHDTFLRREDRQNGDFYSKAPALVPEIDYERVAQQRQKKFSGRESGAPVIERAQRVFTMDLDELLEIWDETEGPKIIEL